MWRKDPNDNDFGKGVEGETHFKKGFPPLTAKVWGKGRGKPLYQRGVPQRRRRECESRARVLPQPAFGPGLPWQSWTCAPRGAPRRALLSQASAKAGSCVSSHIGLNIVLNMVLKGSPTSARRSRPLEGSVRRTAGAPLSVALRALACHF